jgi:hypothetical protein
MCDSSSDPGRHSRIHLELSRKEVRVERRLFLGGLALTALPQPPAQAPEPGRVFDVRRFGALGDGKADDTAPMRRAVAEAAKTGGIVHLPAGDYAVSGPIALPASRVWHLRGEGRTLTRLRPGAGATACDLVSSSAGHRRTEFGCSIEDVTIDGGGLPGTAVNLAAQSLLSMRRVYICNVRGSGLVLDGAWDSILDDVFVESCGTSTDPAVVCRSPDVSGGESMNNVVFLNVHIETNADTTHLDISGTARNPTDTIQFFALKCHGDPRTGAPGRPLIRLNRYTIGCSFFGGIAAWGKGTSQIEVDGSRNKFIGIDHGAGPPGGSPDFAYHFSGNANGNHVLTPNFKNGIGPVVYKAGYMRVDQGAGHNKLLFPQMSTGPTPVPRVLSDEGRGTLFLGDDINDAGGLYLRHGQGFSPLVTNGISATQIAARNLRGSVSLSGGATDAEVKLPTAEADDAYFVTCTVSGVRGKPAPGARRVWLTDKTAQGFRVRCEEAPGGDSAVSVDWILMR